MESFGADCEIKKRAISEIVQHFEWMQLVVEGRITSPYATRFRKVPPLSKREKDDVIEIIDRARSVFYKQVR
jgi:hypothetical protein